MGQPKKQRLNARFMTQSNHGDSASPPNASEGGLKLLFEELDEFTVGGNPSRLVAPRGHMMRRWRKAYGPKRYRWRTAYGPKAHTIPAWGNAPGTRQTYFIPAPTARAIASERSRWWTVRLHEANGTGCGELKGKAHRRQGHSPRCGQGRGRSPRSPLRLGRQKRAPPDRPLDPNRQKDRQTPQPSLTNQGRFRLSQKRQIPYRSPCRPRCSTAISPFPLSPADTEAH